TTVAEHRGKRAGYARYALELVGREEIPVAAGADASLGRYREWPALPDEDVYWPEPIPPAPTSLNQALDLLECSVEQDAIIAAIGPYTNLALLEERSPGILRGAKLCLMGGYMVPPREGFPAWGSDIDYNVQADVRSAQYVIERSNPTLVPLSVTVETSLRKAYLETLRRSGPLTRLIARQAEAFARDEDMEARFGRTFEGLPEDIINFQHDALACAIALGWNEGVEISEVPLETGIEDGWLRQRVDESGKLTRVVTRVDGDAFNEFWLRSVWNPN
ncbi:MAG: nucleoside hydrolase, partial [Rubrobacteraceae bacterium]